MRIFCAILLMFSVMGITIAQETPPAEIKLADLPEVDRLKVENLYLRLESLQAQIQRLQTEAAVIQQDRLPALIAIVKQRKELEGYEFDYQTLSFKKKPNE